MAEFDITDEIVKVLKQYTTSVQLAVDKAVEECGNGLKKDLRATSPKRTGAYGRSWHCDITASVHGGNKATVRNYLHYQLTHLLEKGHKKRGGKGRVKPYVHIAPAADKWENKFEQMCEEACKGK